ncbi:MAG TPA: DUF6660 family protein [Cyclobacteriaceae bacterium]|nr:DUF6660 family protein [Cyclobacteriaceae bacterium]
MKDIVVILSVYILLLAVIPCCVFDQCPKDAIKSEMIYQADNKTHQGGDKDGCGACSPFVTCNTCPVVHFNLPTLNILLRISGYFYE